MIAGKEKPDSGEIAIGPTVKLALVDQSREDRSTTARPFSKTSAAVSISCKSAVSKCRRAHILGRFNFKGGDQQKTVGTLSGGERGRLHLAKTLLTGANVLLLDEPSNDLDVETLRALEDALAEFAGTVLVISHDRWFLDRIATHISRSKATAASISSKATIKSTKPTKSNVSAKKPRDRNAFATGRLRCHKRVEPPSRLVPSGAPVEINDRAAPAVYLHLVPVAL